MQSTPHSETPAGSDSGARAPSGNVRKHRSMPLDSIRTVAILAVLIYHVATRYSSADLDPVAYLFRRYGLLGVDVFFPLSGYLITSYLLRRSNTTDIKVFFLRRFFRIVPLYFAAVTAFLIISQMLDIEAESTNRIWIPYLFLTGWFIFFESPEVVPYTITWSLSVEEFAYILFGLVAWRIRRNFVAILFLICALAIVLRIYLNLDGFSAVYNFPLARLDSIAIGGIVAALWRRNDVLPTLALLTLATYLLAFLMPDLWSSLKYTFIAFATCFVIVLFEKRYRNAQNTPLSWFSAIGFYSYFIYLFHLFNIEFILKLAARFYPETYPPFWGVVALSLMLTQTQAVISFHFFEGPLMRYGKRLERADKHVNAPAKSTGVF